MPPLALILVALGPAIATSSPTAALAVAVLLLVLILLRRTRQQPAVPRRIAHSRMIVRPHPLLPQFRVEARRIFGPVLSGYRFVDAGDSPTGLVFARHDLDITLFYEGEPQFAMGINVFSKRGDTAGQLFDLHRIAMLLDHDLDSRSLPSFVKIADQLPLALEQWKQAFLDLCRPLLNGDLTLLAQPVAPGVITRMRTRKLIQDFYEAAYGAWKEKDYRQLLALYAQLEKLGYQLNDVQKERAAIARREIEKGLPERA